MKLDLSKEIMFSLTYMACYIFGLSFPIILIFDFIQSMDSELYTLKTSLNRLYNINNIFVNSIILKN